MVNTDGATSTLNEGSPSFRFRLKKFDKIQNTPHFDHWKIPLRLLFFITQTELYDGLFHLQYGMIPEDCHIILFDFKGNAASVVLDYGQNGNDKPFVKTPLEILEKSERLTVVEDTHPHNIVVFIKKLSDICPSDISFVFVNITPDEETLEEVMAKRTLLLKNSIDDILEVMTTTLSVKEQKRLHKLVHETCMTLSSNPESQKLIYSRCFASQMALEKCDFPLGLLFSYLVRIRILCLSAQCPIANDVETDPYGFRLISLLHEIQTEFLEKATYMVTNSHRMRIPSLPPLPKTTKEDKTPTLPEGDVIESNNSFEIKTYPKVILADTNFISEFQIYCSTRHVSLPAYSDQSLPIPGENPLYSVSLTTHNRTFQSTASFSDKKTAKSEVTKLAMVELGLIRLSPKALRVMKFLKKGQQVQLLRSPDTMNDVYLLSAENISNEANPVSLLGEFCAKRNFPLPSYATVSEEYGASAITFRVTVTVKTHTAVSDSHASKKMAKRECSQKLLKLLEPLYPETSSQLSPTNQTSITSEALETSTAVPLTTDSNTATKGTHVNYVAALYEFCQGKAMELPKFSFDEIAGVPLRFKARCSIPSLKQEIETTDSYTTKKAAKNAVSELVYSACVKLLS